MYLYNMRYILSEEQYNFLTEQRKSIIQHYFDTKFPGMKRLGKRPTNNRFFGRGFKYFNPDSKEVLFHVVSGGPVYWSGADKTEPKYPGVRLYVDNKIYNDLKSYLGDFENDLLLWFNETYKQGADRVISGIRNF
jgi:hypothetical protein